jgi:hypothetical protein
MRQRALFVTTLIFLLAGCTKPTATPDPTETAQVVPTAAPVVLVDPGIFQLVMVELYDESLIGADLVGTCQGSQCNEGTLPIYEDDYFDPIPNDEIFINFGEFVPQRIEIRLLPWVDGTADRANPADSEIFNDYTESTLRWTPEAEPGRYVLELLLTRGDSAATLWWPIGIGIDPPDDEDE